MSVIKPEELPVGWKLLALDEVSDIIMGQSPSSQFYNADREGLPFFQGKAEFGALYPEPVKWCTAPGKIAQKDDVLISVRAPVGPTNLAPSECCIGRGLAAIRPRNGIPNKYVLYYLRSVESDVEALGTGTTFKAISGKTLKAMPIPVAPSDQQKHIVAEIEKQFSRLDEAVANLKRVKANLKRYKAAVLKAAVEGKLTEQWRKEHPDVKPASKLLERILAERRAKWTGKGKYKEPFATDASNLPPLPEGWAWATAEQLGEITTGFTPPKQNAAFFGGKIPFFKPTDLDAGYYVRNYRDSLTDAGAERGRVLPPFSILVTCIGATIGKTGLARVCCTTNQQINAFVVSTEFMSPEFVFWFFTSPLGQKQITENASATTLPILNKSRFEALPVPLLPLLEQQRIVVEVERRLSMAEELEKEVTANLQRAEHLRQSVLHRAFSGKLALAASDLREDISLGHEGVIQ